MSQAGIGAADLVVVFFTVDHLADRDKLLSVTSEVTRSVRIVGSSSAGVLSGEGEIEGGAGIAVLVLAAEGLKSEPLFFHPAKGRETEMATEVAPALHGKPTGRSLLVLFADPYNARPHRLFEGFEKAFGFVPIVGAGSSENGTQGKTFQLFRDKISANSVCGFSLSGPFEAVIGISQGCQPVTESLRITKADRNFIFEIDNRPAFEVFAKVVKGPLLEDLRRAVTFVFPGFPVDPRENSVTPGRYLVRNIVGIDPRSGVLAVGEEVFEGERMIFTLRDAQRAREDLQQMLERLARDAAAKGPRIGFYFNCCARGTSLYGLPGIDTAYIRKSLGEFPLIGMFGSFEMGPLGGKNRMLAYTGVLVLIKEK